MKPFLTFALLTVAIISQAQTVTQESPDLTIVKFRFERQQGEITGGENVNTVRAFENQRDPPRKNEPERLRNNRDLQDRAAELRAGEQDAARSAAKATDIYVYLIKIKNTSSKPVKSFVWEYHASQNMRETARQFLCEVKTKPNESKEFQVVSTFAPSKIVYLGSTGDHSPEQGRLIINKILYGDGSVWQRTGWDASILSKIQVQKVDSGRCVGLRG
jgi:hypothetical protein